jgi:hypothetical protein
VSIGKPDITRLDCSAGIARWLLSNPICQPWGHRHAILVVATEINAFAAWWPRVYENDPTPEIPGFMGRKPR